MSFSPQVPQPPLRLKQQKLTCVNLSSYFAPDGVSIAHCLYIQKSLQTAATEPFAVQAQETIRVNYFSLLRVSKALFPLLRPHARVVQVSSSAGHLSRIPGAELRAKLSSPDLTEEQLNQLMNDFVE